MKVNSTNTTRDFVIVGSGFGGSPPALRLAEKGYRVLVMERGMRFEDKDFPKSNWNVRKYLWMPILRLYGMMHIDFFRHVLVLHGSGVGGGSLVYGNVLVEPSDAMYTSPAWSRFHDWKSLLAPHFATAKRMLGVAPNPKLWPADRAMQKMAEYFGKEHTFCPAPVGTFFGEAGKTVPDPYFGGKGPDRTGCTHCGGCMIGCRVGAKNTLVKNYLCLAEKSGAEIWAETEVRDIRPLAPGQSDGARYEVVCRSSTQWIKKEYIVRTRSVIVSAGTLGTLRLLFRLRDVLGSLPKISDHLGRTVRTNSEALLGSTARSVEFDYSKGVAITSLFHPDEVTTVEPVRFPAGSSLMRLLSGPVVGTERLPVLRLAEILGNIIFHPVDFAKTHFMPGWANRTTILLVMQTVETCIRLRLGRSMLTFWKRGLVSEESAGYPAVGRIDIAHKVLRMFSVFTDGIRAESWNEGVANIPTTAHILGGVPFGSSAEEGVIGLDFQAHGHPGLYVIDGSVVPANPGFNPSLTITALAEFFTSQIPKKFGSPQCLPAGMLSG